MTTEPESPDSENTAAPTLLQVVASVLAAFFGVQSYKNRKRDFTSGKPWVFIVVGLVMTLLFIGVLLVVVSVVLARSHAVRHPGFPQERPSASLFSS